MPDPVLLGPGLAPDAVMLDSHVYVAFGTQTTGVQLVLLDVTGHEVSRKTLSDGFFNSWPRFGGSLLAYKRGYPSYGPTSLQVLTGEVVTWEGQADGNFGLAVHQALGLVAYQNGAYPIWFGDRTGHAEPSGLGGAADGLDTFVSRTLVTLRKDTRESVPGIFYPVRAGDLVVGEWTGGGGIGVQLDGDVLRVALAGQLTPTPRCATDGTTYVLVTGGDQVRAWFGSRADLHALPTAASLTPVTIGPTTPPRAADGRLYDLAPFTRCDPALASRGGTGQQDNVQVERTDGIILYGKFGQAGAYEMYGLDANWMYSLEDASGPTESQSWTDPRWFPAQQAIGEAHAFVTGPHEAIYRSRMGCGELRRVPFNRKMWLHAVWDGFEWGPDLGVRATTMLVYDPTDGFHAPDRIIEVRYDAYGAGWCRWEAHRSDVVYTHGSAQFTEASLVQRVDFYRLGPPLPQPVLTGCVPPVCPHLPPLPPPEPPVKFDPNVPIGDDQIIELAGIYDTSDTANPGKDLYAYLRDAAYYGFGYYLYRAYGDTHETAREKYRIACTPDGYYPHPPPQMPPDDETEFFAARWMNRYAIIGRLQQQSRVDNARDDTYWCIFYDRQRVQGTDRETAMRNTENGMAQEAGMPLPYPIVRPSPVQQAPLPPFPGPNPPDCPGCQIHTTITQPYPHAYDPRWIRANVWSAEIPGLPFVPGGSSRHPERCLSPFLNRWSLDWQQKILEKHAQQNMSHFQLWTADALAGTYGAIPQSLTDYAAMTKRVKAMGFYVEHMLLSKQTDPKDGTWDTHRAHVQAIHDALVSAGAIDAHDAVDVGWELDLWNIPGAPLQTIIDGVCDLFADVGCRVYVHFSSMKTSWQTDGTSEEDWWRIQASKAHPITGIKWQADPHASIPLMQARFNDIERLFGRIGRIGAMPHAFDPIPYELVAALQFDEDMWTDAMGAMYGYCLSLCTTWMDNQPVGSIFPMGTGQGGNRSTTGVPL